MNTTSRLAFLAFLALSGCSKADHSALPVPEATIATASATAPVGDLAGKYTIKSATNPGGSGGYTGSVQIAKANGYYNLDWTIPGSPSYSGVALLSGNKLGVGWGQGGDFGVVVYAIEGGKLSGSWTTHGASGVGTEDLEGPATLGGTYKITKAKSATGASYTGDVVITQKGDTYLLTWKLAGAALATYDGAGIKEGNRLIVGWGHGGKGAGVVSYTVSGSQLDGKWATRIGGAVGTEVLTK